MQPVVRLILNLICSDATRVDYVKGGLKGFAGEMGLSLTPVAVRAPDGGTDPTKMASLIQQVKELLPDMQDDLIQASGIYNAKSIRL